MRQKLVNFKCTMNVVLILCALLQIFFNICWPILYNVQHENKGQDAFEEGYEKEKGYEGEEHM